MSSPTSFSGWGRPRSNKVDSGSPLTLGSARKSEELSTSPTTAPPLTKPASKSKPELPPKTKPKSSTTTDSMSNFSMSSGSLGQSTSDQNLDDRQFLKNLIELAKSVVLQNKKLKELEFDQKLEREDQLDIFEKESSLTLTLSLELVDYVSTFLAPLGDDLTIEQLVMRENTLKFKEAVTRYLNSSKRSFSNPVDDLAKQDVITSSRIVATAVREVVEAAKSMTERTPQASSSGNIVEDIKRITESLQLLTKAVHNGEDVDDRSVEICNEINKLIEYAYPPNSQSLEDAQQVVLSLVSSAKSLSSRPENQVLQQHFINSRRAFANTMRAILLKFGKSGLVSVGTETNLLGKPATPPTAAVAVSPKPELPPKLQQVYTLERPPNPTSPLERPPNPTSTLKKNSELWKKHSNYSTNQAGAPSQTYRLSCPRTCSSFQAAACTL